MLSDVPEPDQENLIRDSLDYDYNRYDTIRPSSSPTEGVSPIGLRPTNIAARLRSMLACGLGVSPRCSAYEAAYALAIARNHPSMDGNKRSAFVALETVLVLNGHELVAGDVEATVMMLDMAAGTPATGASDAGLHSIQRLNLAQQT